METETDKELWQRLKEAKLKFLHRAGEFAPDSAIIAINSLQQAFEINKEFTKAQREFVKKLVKTSQSLRN